MTLLWFFGGTIAPSNILSTNPNDCGFLVSNGLMDGAMNRPDTRNSIYLDIGTAASTAESNTNSNRVTWRFPTNNRIIMGFALSFYNQNGNDLVFLSPNADTHRFFKLMYGAAGTSTESDVDANTQIGIGYKASTGQIFVTRGSTVIATSSAPEPLFVVNRFIYLELDVKIGTSDGFIKVRANEVEIINFTGNTQNLAGNQINIARIQRIGTNGTVGVTRFYFNDVIMMDDVDDGTVFNKFTGDVYLNTLYPTSDEQAQMTRSTGTTNFSAVDDFTGTTDYVYGEAGLEDIYGIADIPVIASNRKILAIIPWARAMQHDAGPTSFKITLRQLTNLYESATFIGPTTISTGYSIRTLLATNPMNSNAPWTASDVNDLRLGCKVIS